MGYPRVLPTSTPVAHGVLPDGVTIVAQLYGTDGAQATTHGGVSTVAIAAGTVADTPVKAAPGRLCQVLVTAVGTNPMAIWDNAAGHTGTIIGLIPASAAAGSIYNIQMPASAGITVQGNAANPAVTISY